MVDALGSKPDRPPPGFEPLSSSCEFVTRAGTFFMSGAGTAKPTLGTFIGADQADAAGNADRGFLLTFGDFALTELTQGITLRLAADSLGTARIGDWVEAHVTQFANAAAAPVFAEALIKAGAQPLMRLHGAFLPFVNRSRS